MDSFTVYIHLPFCRRRCGYCSFPTTAPRRIPHQRYADAVLSELAARAAQYRRWPLRAVHLGGGTPSLWRADQLARVLDAVRRTFGRPADLELTVECNPTNLSSRHLRQLREAGVNRLSLGVQSLDDAALRLLGRAHSARQARQALERARRVGFDNLGCDLLVGLPDQSLEQHLAQLEQAVSIGLEHLSIYGLTLEPQSPMARAGLRPADDDTVGQLLRQGRQVLAAAGYEQYEVSNHARPGRASRHNSLLWRGQPYLGLGAHAHSMLPHGAVTVRRANPPLQRYLQLWRSAPAASMPPPHGAVEEQVNPARSRMELLMLGLRTTAGVDRAAYRARFGADVDQRPAARELLRQLQTAGMVRLEPGHLRPTAEGIWYADELALRLAAAVG